MTDPKDEIEALKRRIAELEALQAAQVCDSEPECLNAYAPQQIVTVSECRASGKKKRLMSCLRTYCCHGSKKRPKIDSQLDYTSVFWVIWDALQYHRAYRAVVVIDSMEERT